MVVIDALCCEDVQLSDELERSKINSRHSLNFIFFDLH